MLNREAIGAVSAPVTVTVEAGQLRLFARVIGETDPVYFDDEAARRAGHPSLPAPPTFVFSAKLFGHRGEHPFAEIAGLDMNRMLHGEQSFTQHQMIHAGDRITLTTTVTDIYERKGGALEFLVEDTRAVDQNGVHCADMRVVTVFRNA